MNSSNPTARLLSCFGIVVSLLACGSARGQRCWWEPVGGGIDGLPYQMAVFDDGRGPALYVRGFGLTRAGGVAVTGIARWDGTAWSAAGDSGASPVGGAMVTFDDGSGPALYAGGGGVERSQVVRWDGVTWSAFGGGIQAGGFEHWGVFDLAVFDDGSGEALYAGGDFHTPVSFAARWDGQSWSQVGSGPQSSITAMGMHDDGSDPALYVATGHVFGSKWRFQRWDGRSWRGLPGAADEFVYAFQSFDDGNGPALYVAGRFTTIGAQSIRSVARWDGSAWSSIGFDAADYAFAMGVFDDGRGPALYIGGSFAVAGSVPANNIVRWDGTHFEPLGRGLDGRVLELFEFDDGTGPGLYAVGEFAAAGGAPAMNIARWFCSDCYADCDQASGIGVLDMADFLCFQNAFVNSDPYACDCDTSTGPATCDVFDFLCYQDAFVNGCP